MSDDSLGFPDGGVVIDQREANKRFGPETVTRD